MAARDTRSTPPTREGARTRLRRRSLPFAGAVALVALSALVGLKAAASASTGTALAVDSTFDAVDAQPGDGICASAGLGCTLRAAIQEANASLGADVIEVPSGTYALAIPPLNQNDVTTGDLDITDDLVIRGSGAGSTIVDGGEPKAGSPAEQRGLDRLFEIHVPTTLVSFSDLTLQDGYAADYGGAVHNNTEAIVRITASLLRGNYAGKTGGGVDNHLDGAVHVSASTISGNSANESGSALNNNRGGTVTISDSTITGNSAAAVGRDPALVGAGAIGNNAELHGVGAIVVTDSTISDNDAGGSRVGGAISNDGAGSVLVDRTTFSRNRSDADGGAIYNGAGVLTVRDSSFSEGAGDNGGAIYDSGAGSRTIVERSTFILNRAAARGGAIAIASTGELSVTAGTFAWNSAADWGGALANDDKASVTLAASVFSENAGLSGGGFANESDGLVTVSDTTFTKNTALSGVGGGMHTNSVGEVSVLRGSFSENRARDGGGLSNEGNGKVSVSGTAFAKNTAEQEGGGVLVQAGNVTLENVDVVENVAGSGVTGGGGISLQGDKSVSLGESATIMSSRIRSNKAAETGGGIDSRGDGALGIIATTIESNTAKVGGGVDHVGDAPLHIARSTLARNTAELGGGLYTDGDGETTLESSTISANTGSKFGGGLLVSSELTARSVTVTLNSSASGGGISNGGSDEAGDGSVFLRNTIVAANATGGNCAGPITSQGGNIDSADTCGFRELSDQPATDPLLGPLAANGGPTQTHALGAGSPAQDAAVHTETDPCPPTDQRGVTRPHGPGCDVGAFESELTPTPPSAEYCAARVERAALADADAWLAQGAPNNNFGADSILKLKSQSGSNARALVHFLLPSAPAGCELVGATLRLHASSAADGRTLQAFGAGSSWTEAGVTWNNQPLTTGAAATAASGLGYREWDVTTQTEEMYATGNRGFLIRDAAENGPGAGQELHSREKGTDRAPELVLVFDGQRPPTAGCSNPSEVTALASADSWVLQSSSLKNFGSDSVLKVASKSGANSRALVRFGLPPIPAGCNVTEARLRLHASSFKAGRSLHALALGGTWTESGVAWRNQPVTTGPATSAPSASTGSDVEWTVTAQVRGMYAAANHGFVVRDGVESGGGLEQGFHSREKGDDPPRLVITFG